TQNGSITIGGMTFPIAAGVFLPGQNLAKSGAFLCLTPGLSGGPLVAGSQLTGPSPGSLQFSVPAILDGTTNTYGDPHGPDQFLLPAPAFFTVASPAPEGTSVFPVNGSTFGESFYPIENTSVQGLMLSTPHSTVRALTCTDSFWDVTF